MAGAGSSKRDLYLSESVGREAQARAARQANSRDTDAALKRLLKRDKGGMQAVQAARAFAKNVRKKEAKAPGRDSGPSLRKRKKGEEGEGDDDVNDDEGGGSASASENDDGDGAGVSVGADGSTKNTYSARVIKELGFDPGRGRRKGDDDPHNVFSKVRPSPNTSSPFIYI